MLRHPQACSELPNEREMYSRTNGRSGRVRDSAIEAVAMDAVWFLQWSRSEFLCRWPGRLAQSSCVVWLATPGHLCGPATEPGAIQMFS